MLLDMPTARDFESASHNLLNLAWSVGINLVNELDDANYFGNELEPADLKRYWATAQPALSNGFALVQQAQELALKSKIAAISPYILISGSPRDWPSQCAKQDTPFSKFRTPDASDLIKIYNTVCPSSDRLAADFEPFFEQFRVQRNSIMHLGIPTQAIKPVELIIGVLETMHFLFPGGKWPLLRAAYCDNDHLAVVYSTDHVGAKVLKEFSTAHLILKPAERERFFGITKARLYHCPQCRYAAKDLDEDVALAQLAPNSPSATDIYCFVCDEKTRVRRNKCASGDCKSNVICDHEGYDEICLVCFEDCANDA